MFWRHPNWWKTSFLEESPKKDMGILAEGIMVHERVQNNHSLINPLCLVGVVHFFEGWVVAIYSHEKTQKQNKDFKLFPSKWSWGEQNDIFWSTLCQLVSRWWFQTFCFYFHPLNWGEDWQVDFPMFFSKKKKAVQPQSESLPEVLDGGSRSYSADVAPCQQMPKKKKVTSYLANG